MSMTTGTNSGPKCEINLTPMIDVLLTLLVILMMIMPQKKFAIPAEVPPRSENKSASTPASTIVLEVRKALADQTEVRINDQLVAMAQLEPQLRDIYKTRAEKILFLDADPGLDFAQVANVMDTVRSADRDIRIGFMPARAQVGDGLVAQNLAEKR